MTDRERTRGTCRTGCDLFSFSHLERKGDQDGGECGTLARYAEGVTNRYVRRILELAFLAPDITQMILDGQHPADLSTEWLVRGADLPLDWRKQRQVLGLPT